MTAQPERPASRPVDPPEPLDMAGPEPDIDDLLEDAELGTRLAGYVVLAALFVAVVVVWLVTR